MKTKRKSLLTVGFLVVLVGLSGCLAGFITGQKALRFNATKATVSEAALSETDYVLNSTKRQRITRNFSVAGQTRTVKVRNYITEYEKSVSLGPLGEKKAAAFVAFTTPQVEVLGQTFNPVGSMSDRELAERVLSRFENIENLETQGNTTATMLGKSTEVSEFSATATVAGEQGVDINLHLTRVKHASDYVVAIGVYPRRLESQEKKNIIRMIKGVEHRTESAGS
ncbi:MAG: DUF6517 family protein [Halobacteria archaeon]|nr:DUF6517 family protein [Halobacteria archaeon]